MVRRIFGSLLAVASVVLLVIIATKLNPERPVPAQQAQAATVPAGSPIGATAEQAPLSPTLAPYPYPSAQPVPPTLAPYPYPPPQPVSPLPGLTYVVGGPPPPATPTSLPRPTATRWPTATPLALFFPTPAPAGTAAPGAFRAAHVRLLGTKTLVSGPLLRPQWSADGTLILYEVATDQWVEAPGVKGAPGPVKFLLVQFRVRSLVDGRDWQLAPLGFKAAWSPQGDEVAYTVPDNSGQAEYYVSHADGSDRRLVGTGPAFAEVHFAGVGRVAMGKNGGLAILDASTGAVVQQISGYDPTGLASLTTPFWNFSPDGSLLAAYSPQRGSLLILRSDGAPIDEVEKGIGVGPFTWSPGSDALAFVPAGGTVIKVWYRASGRERTLFDAGLLVHNLTWSPDGHVIAFEASPRARDARPGSYRMGLVNADGTEAGYPAWPGVPWQIHWSPDGRYISFVEGSALKAYEVSP